MNYKLLSVILFLISGPLFAQDSKNYKVEQTREASFPNGDNALFTYIFKNLKYTEEAKKNKLEGEVSLSFYVETDSTITNIKVLGGPDFGCRDSLKTMFSKMKYIPALENGHPNTIQCDAGHTGESTLINLRIKN